VQCAYLGVATSWTRDQGLADLASVALVYDSRGQTTVEMDGMGWDGMGCSSTMSTREYERIVGCAEIATPTPTPTPTPRTK
jgi:hypothetical protein